MFQILCRILLVIPNSDNFRVAYIISGLIIMAKIMCVCLVVVCIKDPAWWLDLKGSIENVL